MGTTLGSEDYDGILDLADTLPLMYEEEEDDTGVDGLVISSLSERNENKKDMRALRKQLKERYQTCEDLENEASRLRNERRTTDPKFLEKLWVQRDESHARNA